MTKVLITGSRQIARLPAEVRGRIDTIVEKGFQILVGDANGADNTINNVLNLSRVNKLVVVYMAPAKSFLTVLDPRQRRGLAAFAPRRLAVLRSEAFAPPQLT